MLPAPRSSVPSRRRLRQIRNRIGLGMVASLSMLAGMTDAVGLLVLGDFVSFMSGNTTRLAVSVAEADLGSSLRLLIALVSFVLGNALGVIVGRGAGRRSPPLLVLIAGLLLAAALIPFGQSWPVLLLATLAMGMLNATVEQVNGLPIGLTYVTGALSRFGRGLGRFMLGERPQGWRVQLVPWTGMLAGALIGATTEHYFGVGAFVASAALAGLVALVASRIPLRWQRDFMLR